MNEEENDSRLPDQGFDHFRARVQEFLSAKQVPAPSRPRDPRVRVGDVLEFSESQDWHIRWVAVLGCRSKAHEHFYVAADTLSGWVGTYDIKIELEGSALPFVLRNTSGIWIPDASVDLNERIARFEFDYIALASEQIDQFIADEEPLTGYDLLNDDDPDYNDWLDTIEKNAAELASSRNGVALTREELMDNGDKVRPITEALHDAFSSDEEAGKKRVLEIEKVHHDGAESLKRGKLSWAGAFEYEIEIRGKEFSISLKSSARDVAPIHALVNRPNGEFSFLRWTEFTSKISQLSIPKDTSSIEFWISDRPVEITFG